MKPLRGFVSMGTFRAWMMRHKAGFAELPWAADSDLLAQLFTDGWRMDYRSPIFRTVYAACELSLNPG